MATLNQDIRIEGGADFDIYLNISSSGTRENLTGGVVLAQIKESASSRTSIVTFQTSYLNASNGEAKLTLSAEETRLLPASSVYDVLYKNSGGKVFKLLYGKVEANLAVTEQVL